VIIYDYVDCHEILRIHASLILLHSIIFIVHAFIFVLVILGRFCSLVLRGTSPLRDKI
jgi:hypothetical protein